MPVVLDDDAGERNLIYGNRGEMVTTLLLNCGIGILLGLGLIVFLYALCLVSRWH